MRSFLTIYTIAAMMLAGSAFVTGAQASDAGFGVHFSNRAPAALQDDPMTQTSVDVAVDATTDDQMTGDELNQITPAAGQAVNPSVQSDAEFLKTVTPDETMPDDTSE